MSFSTDVLTNVYSSAHGGYERRDEEFPWDSSERQGNGILHPAKAGFRMTRRPFVILKERITTEESPSNGILCPAKVGFMMTNIRAGFMMTGCVLRRRWEVASDYRHLSYNVL